MYKKLLASLFIGASLLTISTGVHGAAVTNTTKMEEKIDITKYEVTNSEKSAYSTEDKVTLISGKAPTGTPVLIEVFGTTDLTKKGFNLDKLPTDREYIEVFSETVESGNMGFFQKQLNLVMGINKVVVDFGVDEVSPVEIIIYVYDRAPSITEIIPTKR